MEEANVMAFTSMFAETKTLLVKFWAKVAVSPGAFGKPVFGDQLLAMFQYAAVAPLGGAQVKFSAKALVGPESRSKSAVANIRAPNRTALQ